MGHSFANGSPPLQDFSEGAALPGYNDEEMGPTNSFHASV